MPSEKDIMDEFLSSDDNVSKLEIANALMGVMDILEHLRTLADNERKKFIELGWNEENAEMAAMAAYGAVLSNTFNLSSQISQHGDS